MNVQFDFAGRHVMVFGATTGINFGMARGFAAAGAKVSVASCKQRRTSTRWSLPLAAVPLT